MTRAEAIGLAKAIIVSVDHGERLPFGDKDRTFADVCRALLAEVDRTMMAQRYVDELEHDIAVVTQYRKARDSGGQHVGTGGRLGNAPPSTLVCLERLVADLRAVLGKEQP